MSISKAEWRYWVDEDYRRAVGRDGPRGSAVSHRAAATPACFHLVEGDEELADGVTLLPTPGHTPGHLSVLVTSGDETGIVCGDVVLTGWAFEHPEWTAIADVDPDYSPSAPGVRCSIGSSRAAACSPRSTSPSWDGSRRPATRTCSCPSSFRKGGDWKASVGWDRAVPCSRSTTVPELKTVKNRLHLDVEVNEMESATARVLELGG